MPKNRFFTKFSQCNSAKGIFSISRKILFDMVVIEEPIGEHLPKNYLNIYNRGQMGSKKVKLVNKKFLVRFFRKI